MRPPTTADEKTDCFRLDIAEFPLDLVNVQVIFTLKTLTYRTHDPEVNHLLIDPLCVHCNLVWARHGLRAGGRPGPMFEQNSSCND